MIEISEPTLRSLLAFTDQLAILAQAAHQPPFSVAAAQVPDGTDFGLVRRDPDTDRVTHLFGELYARVHPTDTPDSGMAAATAELLANLLNELPALLPILQALLRERLALAPTPASSIVQPTLVVVPRG